jgi:hypothetical protein
MYDQRLSVSQYQQLASEGVLTEDENLELLDGYLVPKATKTPLHGSHIDILHGLLRESLPVDWFVRN